MNSNLPQDRVCPVDVANKFAAARNYPETLFARALLTDGELREIVWFIQWKSLQPGGLKAFAQELIAQHPSEVGPLTLISHRGPWPKRLDIATWLRVYADLPFDARPLLSLGETLGEEHRANGQSLATEIRRYPSLPIAEIPAPAARALTETITPADFLRRAQRAAADHLPGLLYQFCTEPGFTLIDPALPANPSDESTREEIKRALGAAWFMPRLLAVLRAVVSAHAAKERARIAATSVREKIFDALDFGWERRGFVEIQGSTRFGKSESVRNWAQAHPGRARYFAVPSDHKGLELNRALADALGIAYEWGTPAAWLGDRVNYVLQFADLMILADEAHFLLPARYSKTTQPQRMNWFRTQLVDRKVPCAIIVTPQTYSRDLKQFTRATGYVMDQWLGRPNFRASLPDELTDADLEAVCKHYLPNMSPALSEDLIGRAMLAPSFLKAFEDVATRASYLARRAGRASPSQPDIRTAMEEVLPAAVQQRAASPAKRSESAPRPKPGTASTAGPRIAGPLQESGSVPATSRHNRFSPTSDPVELLDQREVLAAPE